jgi:hypothetical protein
MWSHVCKTPNIFVFLYSSIYVILATLITDYYKSGPVYLPARLLALLRRTHPDTVLSTNKLTHRVSFSSRLRPLMINNANGHL